MSLGRLSAGLSGGRRQRGKRDGDVRHQPGKPLLHHQQQHGENPHEWRHPGQGERQRKARSPHEDHHRLSRGPWVFVATAPSHTGFIGP